MIFQKLAIICTMLFAVAGTPGDGNAEVIQEGPKTCQGMALTFDLCPVREGAGYDQPLIEFLKDDTHPGHVLYVRSLDGEARGRSPWALGGTFL